MWIFYILFEISLPFVIKKISQNSKEHERSCLSNFQFKFKFADVYRIFFIESGRNSWRCAINYYFSFVLYNYNIPRGSVMHSIMFISNNIDDHENLMAFSNSNNRFTFLKLPTIYIYIKILTKSNCLFFKTSFIDYPYKKSKKIKNY